MGMAFLLVFVCSLVNCRGSHVGTCSNLHAAEESEETKTPRLASGPRARKPTSYIPSIIVSIFITPEIGGRAAGCR
ncbi:hypothetical protein OF83DRAFT_296569 [Amylostereum chailletii]|nr:hypothetical protein OF83DRAFT_296569 [Amylostereum chailletii]